MPIKKEQTTYKGETLTINHHNAAGDASVFVNSNYHSRGHIDKVIPAAKRYIDEVLHADKKTEAAPEVETVPAKPAPKKAAAKKPAKTAKPKK